MTLLAANLAVPPPEGVSVIETPSAADLEREALGRADADVIVMAAAVADYRAAAPSETKRAKDGAFLACRARADRRCPRDDRGRSSRGQVIVGFAADEGEAGLERAREKRRAKNADLFVFNDIARSDIGFDAEENEVVVVSANGDRVVAKAPKRAVAAAVLDEVERLLSTS